MNTIDKIINIGRSQMASDIHFTVGQPPIFRINGELKRFTKLGNVTDEVVKGIIQESLPTTKQMEFHERKQIDYAYETEDGIRLRCNAYIQRKTNALSLRILNDTPPTIEGLGLPKNLNQICDLRSGLILVTGPTGSGKSSSLAAMIHHINETRACKIITIEDPIEYTHTPIKALINQREIGEDTLSFHESLRGALRQDPDVLLIGEMRDLESISIAVTAAETGHLCLSSLHTMGAAQTIDRLIDVFPPHQQSQIRIQLAETLKSVISQKLLIREDKTGRVPVFELMVVNDAISNNIREGKTSAIGNIIQTNAKEGMITFERSLADQVRFGVISRELALAEANDPNTLLSILGR